MADKIRKTTYTTAEIDAAVDMLLEMYTRNEIDNLLAQKVKRLATVRRLSIGQIENVYKRKFTFRLMLKKSIEIFSNFLY